MLQTYLLYFQHFSFKFLKNNILLLNKYKYYFSDIFNWLNEKKLIIFEIFIKKLLYC